MAPTSCVECVNAGHSVWCTDGAGSCLEGTNVSARASCLNDAAIVNVVD